MNKLVAVPSVSDRKDELERALDLVVDAIFKTAPTLTVERFNCKGKSSILAYKGSVRPQKFKLLLNGHVDVVPGTLNQFEPVVRQGHLYGRGVLDMKGAVAVMTRVFCELAPTLNYPVGLQIVTDEEIGGHSGTKYQIEHGVAADFVICGEFTPSAALCTESRGICQVRVVFEGRAAHSAYPWDGKNAILAAQHYSTKLLEYYPVPLAKTWATTANISTLSTANTTLNQVPALATLGVDIRYIAEDPHFQNQQTALQFLQQLDPSATVEITMFESGHHVDRENTYVQLLAQTLEQTWKTKTQFIQKPGAADVRFYSALGVPAVILGLQGEGLHGDEEYIELASLERYYRLLSDFLHRV